MANPNKPEVPKIETDAPEVQAKPKTEGSFSMTAADLKELVSSIVSSVTAQSGEASAKILAEAILESRKPYKDPLQEKNAEAMRLSDRELQKRLKQEVDASRDNCEHLQGSNALSEQKSDRGSFVLHQLDTGELIGICTNCQKEISSLRPEDKPFFKKQSGNRMSRAGQRMFTDPLKAQRARFQSDPQPSVAIEVEQVIA